MALSDVEIATLHSRGMDTDLSTGLMAFWHFDEGEGVTTINAGPTSFQTLLRQGASWIQASGVPTSDDP